MKARPATGDRVKNWTLFLRSPIEAVDNYYFCQKGFLVTSKPASPDDLIA